MVIIETSIFTRKIVQLISDEDYRSLQLALILRPAAGDLIPGGKGLRKLRWNLRSTGKRGGLRIIYYYDNLEEKIYMLLSYKKSEQEDLTKEQIRKLSNYLKEGVL